MSKIAVLDENTIDKIAAGEVIERPASVVKELVENAIDAGANAITVEIKDGGISFIRITDNGAGIEAEEIPKAFLRHATSKITKVEDLLSVTSLGFRGEALSSISAVCQVELISKTPESLTGCRYIIEGGKEKERDEIGAPTGTTFLIRNIFFNTPARKKFLKTPQTEAGYISDLMERMALSHPEIAFKFINNGQTRLHTSGNHNRKDIIYNIYGRDIAGNILEIQAEEKDGIRIAGYIGKPVISRGNRNYENYFINGRYVKSKVISKAIEDAYASFMMKHQYPFTAIAFWMDGEKLDINVHPTKMEVRFDNNESVYRYVYETIHNTLSQREMIPRVSVDKNDTKSAKPKNIIKKGIPEPFEQKRKEELLGKPVKLQENKTQQKTVETSFMSGFAAEGKTEGKNTKIFEEKSGSSNQTKTLQEELKDLEAFFREPEKKSRKPFNKETSDFKMTLEEKKEEPAKKQSENAEESGEKTRVSEERKEKVKAAGDIHSNQTVNDKEDSFDTAKQENEKDSMKYRMEELANSKVRESDFFTEKLLDQKNVKQHRIIGQLFDTYWLIEFQNQLFIVDQHAAHEKVLYERTIKGMANREYTSQILSPPVIMTLSMQEENLLKKHWKEFTDIGFEIEAFGGKEYALRAVPDNLFSISKQDLFVELLDSLDGQMDHMKADSIQEKIASMSCKAAVKGNNRLSVSEVHALIDELMTLDNPYHCPHGRPTIISMSKYEIEKKFKRII